MRLHVLGLVHTELTREWSACAYTQRTLDFCDFMTDQGYEVISYGGERCDARVMEHVPIVLRSQQRTWYPDQTPNGTAMYNDFNSGSLPWRVFNLRASDEIRKRWQAGDVVCATQGVTHQPACDALTDLLGMNVVETGIGYTGVFAKFRIFESEAWRHFMAAKEPNDNLRWYDDVIPRGYFVDQFPEGRGGNDLLFMGRLISRKGPQIAGEISKQLGVKLLVAGQGMLEHSKSKIITTDGTTIEGNLEYLGVLGPAERARVMGSVRAVVMPTTYLEPGGGVAIEAQLCGTPVITVPYGAMTETVVHGRTGFHCGHLAEFLSATDLVRSLDRGFIRESAQDRFGSATVGAAYSRYFTKLQTLDGAGWYAVNTRGTLPAQSQPS